MRCRSVASSRCSTRRDGSLGTHLRKLEDAGYLSINKTYRGRRPVTWYQLSTAGRTRLKQHVASLMRLINRAG